MSATGTKTEQQGIGLINASTDIKSDFEKANVLFEIARRMPTNESRKIMYMKAAKTISSEDVLARVVKSMPGFGRKEQGDF